MAGKHYSAEAIEDAYQLFLRFNGDSRQWHRIDAEMAKKGYVGFKARNCFPDRGKGTKRREGWITKFGWEKGLAIHLASKPTATLNTAQKVARRIEEVNDRLYEQFSVKGAALDEKQLQLLRDFFKLQMEALTKVHEARDTLGGFVSFWERFIDWITDIDSKTARALLGFEDLIRERAEKEFGETESMIYRREAEGSSDGGDQDQSATANAGTEV
jgi:hypothetical protein